MPFSVSILPAIYLVLIGGLACIADATGWGHEHLWAFRPVAPYHYFFWLLGFLASVPGILLLRRTPRAPQASSLAQRSWKPGIATAAMVWGLLTAVAVALLYLFRQRLFLAPPDGLGDSLLILEQVPVYSHLLGYLDSFDELLELYLHCKLYLFGSARFGWQVEQVYAGLSIGAFVLYGSALFLFLHRRTLIEILYGSALLLFVPALQLYAGYVEHYTLATATLAITIIAGTMILERQASAGPFGYAEPSGSARSETNPGGPAPAWPVMLVAGCAAIAVLHHSINVVILPALIFLVWELAGGNRQRVVQLAGLAASVALPILVSVWCWFLFFADPPLAFFDSHVSSPPVHRPGELFRPEHLRDILNLLFLASPAGPLIAAVLIALRSVAATRATIKNDGVPGKSAGAALDSFEAENSSNGRILTKIAPRATHRFLLIATFGLVGITFVIESLIGFPADWDLLTMYQFPLNLYLFFIVRHYRRAGQLTPLFDWTLLAVILAVHMFVSFTWIARNAESSATSRANVEQARQNVNTSLRIIRADPVFLSVEQDRKKLYIQVKLFFVRSRNRLTSGMGGFSPAERSDLLSALSVAETRFSEWMLLPDEVFRERYQALWKDFSALNVRINAPD